MKLLLLFLFFVVGGQAALLQYKLKPGERGEIGMDKHVQTWERVRDGVKEYIKYCEPGDNAVHCIKFVTEDGKVGTPETKAIVLKNGKLILEKVQKHDEGLYSSPDADHHPNTAPVAFNIIIA